MIVGYDFRCERRENWRIVIENGGIQPPQLIVKPENDGHLIWNGQVRAINRLLLGNDDNLMPNLPRMACPKKHRDK